MTVLVIIVGEQSVEQHVLEYCTYYYEPSPRPDLISPTIRRREQRPLLRCRRIWPRRCS